MDKELELLGKRIRELRRNSDLSIEVLSERIGRTARHLQSIENGRGVPSFEVLVKLANTFEVTLRDLFDYSETRKIPVMPFPRAAS